MIISHLLKITYHLSKYFFIFNKLLIANFTGIANLLCHVAIVTIYRFRFEKEFDITRSVSHHYLLPHSSCAAWTNIWIAWINKEQKKIICLMIQYLLFINVELKYRGYVFQQINLEWNAWERSQNFTQFVYKL